MTEDKRKTLFVLLGLTAVTLAVFRQVHGFEFTDSDGSNTKFLKN
jgi:hypothetical protein